MICTCDAACVKRMVRGSFKGLGKNGNDLGFYWGIACQRIQWGHASDKLQLFKDLTSYRSCL